MGRLKWLFTPIFLVLQATELQLQCFCALGFGEPVFGTLDSCGFVTSANPAIDPLFAGILVVFAVFAISVIFFVKSTELQNIGLATWV